MVLGIMMIRGRQAPIGDRNEKPYANIGTNFTVDSGVSLSPFLQRVHNLKISKENFRIASEGPRATLPAIMEEPEPQDSVESRSVDDGSKRRADDQGPSQTRAKRNRYVAIACNECKRRKIKCNGETPCSRCGNLHLECVYAANCCSNSFKDSQEFRLMNDRIHSLQEQVNNLYASLNAYHSKSDGNIMSPEMDAYQRPISFTNSMSPPSSRAKVPQYQGPTSSAYNFDVANSSLQTMGIAQPVYGIDEGLSAQDGNPPSTNPQQAPMTPTAKHSGKNPLWSLNRDEVLRLCRLYDEEVGIMYPIVDIEEVTAKADKMMMFMASIAKTKLFRRHSETDAAHSDDIDILKMILATALMVEGSGQSDLGHQLYASVCFETQKRVWEPASINGLIVLVLAAEYHFYLDQEAQAYRIIGIAARMCFEIGLHRYEVLKRTFESEIERRWITRLFWSIYILDRRWSFGAGMPFAIQESDIDPNFPKPDDRTPYLAAMVSHGHISSKVWHSLAGVENTGNEIQKDSIDYLDYQVRQWRAAIPEDLIFRPSDNSVDQNGPSRPLRRLRTMLYLRGNQLFILIYRPVLHSATSIMEWRQYAQTVVDVAKDTISLLAQLNQTSDIYRAQQICYNYFLVSALAVLFLAVSHAPIEFSHQVRAEWEMALDLVKGFSTKSYISQRLWRMIRGLKEIGPRLGLVSQQALPENNDAHSSAAMAMAGLAGHHVDQLAMYPPTEGEKNLRSIPLNGEQMSLELTSLFEAAGSYPAILHQNGARDGMNGFMGPNGEVHTVGDSISALYGNEDEFAMIMRNCF